MPNYQPGLFGTFNQSENCHRPLPSAYQETLCPVCKEQLLFHEVKDFIRENDVNEYQVAEHFKIPVRQVKEWIREGRIEYKTAGTTSLGMHCQRCGASVAFGSLCPKCLKLINHNNVKGTALHKPEEQTKMRFLDKDSE